MRLADALGEAMIVIEVVVVTPLQRTAGVAGRERRNRHPVAALVVVRPIGRPKEFRVILLAQSQMFLKNRRVVVDDAVIVDPRLFGTELRDPLIGEVGEDIGLVLIGELLQLLEGSGFRIECLCGCGRRGVIGVSGRLASCG